mmetsp:Transcript_1766/g.6965  ORF Transcript_1766/g.6965 Transcript_1766/m.6965 type:complete len:81 (+) Transcript_1766:108-350(+)
MLALVPLFQISVPKHWGGVLAELFNASDGGVLQSLLDYVWSRPAGPKGCENHVLGAPFDHIGFSLWPPFQCHRTWVRCAV